MKLDDINLYEMLQFHPESGQILLGQERMLLFRQGAFAILRKLLRKHLGESYYKKLLFEFGYACGKGDYENLTSAFDWDTEADKMGSGPVMHSWEGIVRSESQIMDFDHETGYFYHIGLWKNSYEAEIHLQEFGLSDEAVCYTLTGYASGYGSAFTGRDLLAIERKCVGKGDEVCEVEMKPVKDWDADKVAPWLNALAETTGFVRIQEEIIKAQKQVLQELMTPIIPVVEGIIIMPLVGSIDSSRAREITRALLAGISTHRAKVVILDVTGVAVIDSGVADHLNKTIQAARLKGARTIITGISDAVAETVVDLGIDWGEVDTLRDLQTGLVTALAGMGKQIIDSKGRI
ncbi:MAG: XylR N-terminal domain-containing protein [Anaerolineae bacterium]|nr:XylR N-terminal domain-containing protein [Anaerolineae bacterium]